MLDRLPLELVELIVLLALPSPDSPLSYYDRQDTLRALCLVSRPLNDIAQPLLFKHVDVRANKQLATFLKAVEGRPDLGKAVRVLRIGCPDGQGSASALSEVAEHEVSKLARTCPRVEAVEFRLDVVELKEWQQFVHLKRLHIVGSTLIVEESFIFRHVEDLSLHNYCGVVDERFLRSLPALRTFHYQMEHHEEPPPPAGIILNLLKGGTLVVCDRPAQRNVDHLPTDTASAFDGCEDVRNLRIRGSAGGVSISPLSALPAYANSDAWFFDDLADDLERGVYQRLLTLYLPSSLRPTLQSLFSELSASITALLGVCASRSIEVIFEPEPHPCLDSFISPTFLKRCEAIKAAEAAASMTAEAEHQRK
ncbi:hypothetical protein JCM10207_006805 [Rhodosporidiobolus poonsookiae]